MTYHLVKNILNILALDFIIFPNLDTGLFMYINKVLKR